MLTNLLELLSNRKDIRNLMEIGREKKHDSQTHVKCQTNIGRNE